VWRWLRPKRSQRQPALTMASPDLDPGRSGTAAMSLTAFLRVLNPASQSGDHACQL
jgi:hypothetical protein